MDDEKDDQIRHIESIQEFIKESDIPIKDLDDFKEWNLIPGQQLFYKRLIWPSITHHAIYVGNGTIFEGGFNPSSLSSLFMSFINPPIMLKPLKEYIQRSKKSHIGPISVIYTEKDSDRDEILQRLERIKNLLNVRTNWHPLKTNCEGMANYISHGHQFSLQSLEWRSFFLWSFIILIGMCVLIWFIRS